MAMHKNTRVLLSLLGTLCVMAVLTALAVPAYRAFCSATGFNGTARKAAAASKIVVNRIVEVHFDANTNGVPWSFKPDQASQMTRVGKTAMMMYTVKNNGSTPVTARAAYNILPDTMGPYFMKLQCFCFTNQTLAAGEERRFPVVYFLDPKLMTDNDTKDVPDVTLSYTFFPAKDDTAAPVKK